jgi:6-phosphogluconolactonase (cycloisomerase 2 family)
MRILGRIVFLGIMLAALVLPLAAQSNRPIFIYIAENSGVGGTVGVFKVDSVTGALSPVQGSPFQAGVSTAGLAVDSTGRFVYVTDGGSNVRGYSVNATTGVLTPLPGSPYPAGGSTGPDPQIPIHQRRNPSP